MALSIQDYLRELHEVYATGAGLREQSLYPALLRLLNTIGRDRRPRVFCVAQLADTGAEHPDYGLFTVNQLSRDDCGAPRPGALPERGVVEAKPPDRDVHAVAATFQVTDYWDAMPGRW